VVVCGRDERLRRSVATLAEARPGHSVVLGWTDDMPALMSGCDALVENAGGLTSFEAMRAGLPVVSFLPIAGHGRANTASMDAAGVSRLASSPDELVDTLATLTTPGPVRARQVAAGQALFRRGADTLTLEAATSVAPVPLRRRPAAYVGRAAAAMVAVAALGWTGLTSGVEVAAAAGAGVAHPPAGASDAAFVGVRLNAQELASDPVRSDLARMDVSAVVDRMTAMAEPRAVRAVAAQGVSVASGGRGDWTTAPGHDTDSTLWARAQGDARAGKYLQRLTGAPVTVLVPGRRVNAWDLIDCGHAHSSLVVPDHVVDAQRAALAAAPLHLTARRIYLINGLGATPGQLAAVLDRLDAGLAQAGLVAEPLSELA
jgi:hypothetical protein